MKQKYKLQPEFIFTTIILILAVFSSSCKKDWLDAKPNQGIVVPKTLNDFEALLNNDIFCTTNPAMGELSADDHYYANSSYQSRADYLKNLYSWSSADAFYADRSTILDWQTPYKQVYSANVILNGLEKLDLDESNAIKWKKTKGSALFFRATAFYNLAQLFCKPYISSSANTDLGIILRTDYDAVLPSVRATVKQTYDQILADLLLSKSLLPSTSAYKSQPSKPAVYAMLARVYLSMNDYDNAWLYADSCLKVQSTLMDYNNNASVGGDINSALANPFKMYNSEVILHSILYSISGIPGNSGVSFVDTSLFQLYNVNDWRKTLFFKTLSGNRLAFIGSYNGPTYMFNGLATDEIYLIRSECYARKGNKDAALTDLNTLVQKRWKNTVPYPTITAVDAEDALQKILVERRKELCFRSSRWTDLRRLNLDSRFAITIKHGLFGASPAVLFTLPPNDNRYVLPFPNDEILFSGVTQNPR